MFDFVIKEIGFTHTHTHTHLDIMLAAPQCECVCVCVRACYLHVLYSAWLSLTQHVEQQQDQVLDVLQRLLLGNQVRMHLVQHLHNTHKHRSTHTYEGHLNTRF